MDLVFGNTRDSANPIDQIVFFTHVNIIYYSKLISIGCKKYLIYFTFKTIVEWNTSKNP